ncbi:hypothetical protein DMUE_2150 [Dictyocoela muelleri]|nr:hypothetical protein DMUE_2150 [Dictyocoela muelleri]
MKKKYSRKDILVKFNLTKSVGDYILKNLNELSNLSSSEATLKKRRNLSKAEHKYSIIDDFILEKIKSLRFKKICVTRNVIIGLVEDFYRSIGVLEKKATLHFVNCFIKRHNLSYISLHGNSASADGSLIANFKEKLEKKCLITSQKTFLI